MSVIDKIKKIKPAGDFCTAVIVAAGNSQRMGRDKILMPLLDAPVIAHTLKVFEDSEFVDEIIVVTRYESMQAIAELCGEFGITKIRRIVRGGRTRAESALIGVCEADRKATLIAIHDGARPFPTDMLIERCVLAAKENLAAAPAVTATDTVRIVNKKGTVVSTPDRNLVALIQTPQVFQADLIKGALTKAVEKNTPVTDDCAAVEAMGYKVSIVAGEYDNIKLTTERDIYVAEKILSDRRARK